VFKTLVEVCQNDGLDPSVVVWLDAGIWCVFVLAHCRKGLQILPGSWATLIGQRHVL
jgi:hypothetical protein